MTVFTRLIITFALSLLCFQAVWADDACNNPVEPSLQGETLSTVVDLKDGVTAQPLGKEVNIVIPTTLANRSGAKLIACVRWQPKLKDSELKAAVVEAIEETVSKIEDAQKKAEQSSDAVKKLIDDSLTNTNTAQETAKKANAQKTISTINAVLDKIIEAQEIVSSTVDKASGTEKLKTALNAAEDAARIAVKKAEVMQQGFKVWSGNLPLRVIKSESDVTTVSIRLPKHLNRVEGKDPSGFWSRPTAELRLIVTEENAAPTLDTLLHIHIASFGFASLMAVLSSIVFCGICVYIAKSQKISGSLMLVVITNKYGYASLSQLQIMLWTFVVASSAIYVMVLTGRLIDIEPTMLGLLGVAGFSSVLTLLKPTGENQNTTLAPSLTNPALLVPESVINLQVCGAAGATQLVLAWNPPTIGGMPKSYKIEYTASGLSPVSWIIAIPNTQDCLVTISGLNPDTAYDFKVTAVNANGEDAGTIIQKKTAPVPANPATTPLPVQGVSSKATSTTAAKTTITMSWEALNSLPDGYVVRYREAGDSLWNYAGFVGSSEKSFNVDELYPTIDYCFEVFAVTAGQLGGSGTSQYLGVSRQPAFSDLLMDQSYKEIDVSRIQMLFFTLIAAVFVVLKVISSHDIPEIPQGILLLMGISNGVYLTAKFIQPPLK